MLQIVKVNFESLSSVTVNHHYYTVMGVKPSESLENTYAHLGHHNYFWEVRLLSPHNL